MSPWSLTPCIVVFYLSIIFLYFMIPIGVSSCTSELSHWLTWASTRDSYWWSVNGQMSHLFSSISFLFMVRHCIHFAFYLSIALNWLLKILMYLCKSIWTFHDKSAQFNARSESVHEKASFRRLLPKCRCLAIAEGYTSSFAIMLSYKCGTCEASFWEYWFWFFL